MSSTRLPGKVLMPLGKEESVLTVLLTRLRGARELDDVVVATSWDASDDPVASAASQVGVAPARGPLDDVLARFVLAAEQRRADAVVRITADCPLIDPGVVDELVRIWRRGDADYVSNTLEPRTFPDGLDAEVISRSALIDADHEASLPEEREHVTPFIRAHPDRFVPSGIWLQPSYGEVRVTLDDETDLTRLTSLVESVGANPEFDALMVGLGLPAGAHWTETRRA